MLLYYYVFTFLRISNYYLTFSPEIKQLPSIVVLFMSFTNPISTYDTEQFGRNYLLSYRNENFLFTNVTYGDSKFFFVTSSIYQELHLKLRQSDTKVNCKFSPSFAFSDVILVSIGECVKIAFTLINFLPLLFISFIYIFYLFLFLFLYHV